MMTNVGIDVGERAFYSLFHGVQTSAATLKISVELPQKARNRYL